MLLRTYLPLPPAPPGMRSHTEGTQGRASSLKHSLRPSHLYNAPLLRRRQRGSGMLAVRRGHITGIHGKFDEV